MNDLATFRFNTVFVSDLHLGSGKTATPYLYEFLKHLDFTQLKSLYLVGDVVGGWEMQSRRQ
jgi:UDP-2,3-diacylglucosamine pyrophosphatase LpxH